MRRIFHFPLLLLACQGLFAQTSFASFPLADVHLLPGSPFYTAQQTDLAYLLAHDPDRLLAPYLREAGLAPKAPTYGNWEGSGLDGHTAGHYLSALAMLYAGTGLDTLSRRLDYMLHELARCQNQDPHAYIGGVPRGRELWNEIAAGDIRADNFSLNGRWVPWYNLHKTFAGLRDVYVHTGKEQALRLLLGLADWADRLVADLSDAQVQDMLRSEHGGMNEVLADVAALTGNDQYLALAERFSHQAILDPLLRAEDELTGLHANTQIPKVIGYARVAELADKPDWWAAAQYFWQTVVDHRTVAIGGNSVREHFHPTDDFSRMIEDVQGPETCNTYNMLRLSKMLYLGDGDPRYLDYYERALYNHILSSQHPERGGFVYFTPMRPGHYRVYSQPEQAFWCCVGSGMENHAKYGELIYARREDDLAVNLFLSSVLRWPEKGLTLFQQTNFPEDATTQLFLALNEPRSFSLLIRQPEWVRPGGFRVEVNGEPVSTSLDEKGYLALTREWQDGDHVALAFDLDLRLEQLPDGSDYHAFLYGPIVLAAPTGRWGLDGLQADDTRMGHIAAGPTIPLPEAPRFLGEPAEVLAGVEPIAYEPLHFQVPPSLVPDSLAGLELQPFYQLHDTRYVLYWPITGKEAWEARQAALEEQEAERAALLARTIDEVQPGEQQPEAEHKLRGEGMDSGLNGTRRWRHASAWFSYELHDPTGEARLLRITYFGLDAGREFSIVVNGTPIAEVHLKGENGPDFVGVDYPLPVAVRHPEGKYEVKFVAQEGSVAGGIYGVRLLRE